MRRLSIVFAIALAGCQTQAEFATNTQTRLEGAFVGRPVSNFLNANGMTPYDAYNLPGNQRVFLFDLPCKSSWYTTKTGTTNTIADYRVDRIQITGYCSVS